MLSSQTNSVIKATCSFSVSSSFQRSARPWNKMNSNMEKQLKQPDWFEKSRATWQKNKSTQSPECFIPTPTWVVWEAAIKYSSFVFPSAWIVLSFQRSKRRGLFCGTTLVLSFATKLLSKDIKVITELDTWELVRVKQLNICLDDLWVNQLFQKHSF